MTVPQNPTNAPLNPTPDAGPDDPGALNARSDGLAGPGSVPAAAPTTLPVDVVDDARHVRGASNSVRPTYVGPHALAPAEGGGGDPARAPGLGVVAAEGSRDQEQPSAAEHADSTPPVHATAAVSADADTAAADVIAPAAPVGRPVRASLAAQRRRGPKRRPKNFERPLAARVTLRVDPEVKARWQAEAAEADDSLALMLERRLLAAETGTAPRSSVADALDALVDELAAVRPQLGAWGNNLNQIARQLNMGGTLPADPGAIRFLDRGQELVEQVRGCLRAVDSAVTGVAKARRRA